MKPSYLFSRLDIYSVMEQQKTELRKALMSAPESLSELTDSEVIEQFLRKFDVAIPVLRQGEIEMMDQEVQQDVSSDPFRMFLDRSKPFFIAATKLSVHVPFDGEAIFFEVQPNSFSLSPPRGSVGDNELVLTYQFTNDAPPTNIRQQIDRDIAEIKTYLQRLEEAATIARSQMRFVAIQAWQQRKSQFAAKSGVIASLGLPRRLEQDRQIAPAESLPPSRKRQSIDDRRISRRAIPSVSASWDAFISYASEDKESIAKPLAEALLARGFKVWYDDKTLTIGDSLRQKIDEGLSRSRYGIIILSPSFFAKHWPQQELNGLAAREVDGVKVILPVWHGVGHDDVLKRSPMLADRIAASSSIGLDSLVGALTRAMQL